jgi:hypothetical protein
MALDSGRAKGAKVVIGSDADSSKDIVRTDRFQHLDSLRYG